MASNVKYLPTLMLIVSFVGYRAAFAAECPPLVTTPEITIGSIKHPSGLLWRVVRPGKAENFLLGTMHVSDPRVTSIADIVADELERSERFAMELLLDADVVFHLQAAMFYLDGRRLSDIAGRELFELAAGHLENYGIPAVIANTMKPWAVFTALSLPVEKEGLPLDLILMMRAQAAGKELISLETVEEQIAVFESIAENDQIEMLREVACHYVHFQEDIERMVQHYERRDLLALTRLSLRYVTDEKQAFLDKLLWQRNEKMVQRLEPLFDEGKVFVAVGAMHLPGERGILRRLEQQGFVVEAIY
ncbi:MAG: TraB/GumN family protein [Gammaproteobacteria bacterium]|nr:TraB/GumN family protein [Gammaproteobacteria bacterium]